MRFKEAESYIFLIPCLLVLALFGRYLVTPFDNYDIWLERIAYCGAERSNLPDLFSDQKIFPLGILEYIDYRGNTVGRLFGMAIPYWLGFKLFSSNVILWRTAILGFVFMKFFLSDKIMILLKIKPVYRLLVLLLLVTLFERYYIKVISFHHVVGNLLLLSAFYLELKNSLVLNGKLRYSIYGATLLFLAVFVRELYISSALAFLFLLITTREGNGLKFNLNLKRIIPYLVSAFIFIVLFLIFTSNKTENTYANALAGRLTFFEFLYASILEFLTYIGFGYSAALGCILILILVVFVIKKTIAVNWNVFSSLSITEWSFVLMFISLVPLVLLLSYIGYEAKSFSLQYLLGCIAGILIIQKSIQTIKNRQVYSAITTLSVLFVLLIFVARTSVAMQNIENQAKEAHAIKMLSEVSNKTIPLNGSIILDNDINIQIAYSLAANLFLDFKRNDIGFRYSSQENGVEEKGYYGFMVRPLMKSEFDFSKVNTLKQPNNTLLTQSVVVPIRNYSIVRCFLEIKSSIIKKIIKYFLFPETNMENFEKEKENKAVLSFQLY